MNHKTIISGRLEFGNSKSYEKVLKMYQQRLENFYRTAELIFKIEEVFDETKCSLEIPRLVTQSNEKSWQNTLSLLEYVAGFAVAGDVRAWMTGTHSWQANGELYQVQVQTVKITSQATGALFDYLLDAQGGFIPANKGHIKKELGIMSIGFNTVELLVVQDSAPVQRFTAGSTNGVRRLFELLNPFGLYSLGELDTQVRLGNLPSGEALTVWEREVSGQVERVWGTAWRRFANIILVGGGAVLLQGPLTKRFNGKAMMPDQPVMAIARGLHKLALMQQRRGV